MKHTLVCLTLLFNPTDVAAEAFVGEWLSRCLDHTEAGSYDLYIGTAHCLGTIRRYCQFADDPVTCLDAYVKAVEDEIAALRKKVDLTGSGSIAAGFDVPPICEDMVLAYSVELSYLPEELQSTEEACRIFAPGMEYVTLSFEYRRATRFGEDGDK